MKPLILAFLCVAAFAGAAEARPGHRDTSPPAAESGDGYYTNVNGHRVHRPVQQSTRPAGATARCGDGSYSFSENHRGTCSHHGGVSTWYR